MGFSRAELESYRDAAVPDLVGPGLKLLFVGINPGLWTAATQTHFAHPGNRFYPALRAAGIVDRDLDRAAGMTDDDRGYLIGRGIGITNLVNRATHPRRRALDRASCGPGVPGWPTSSPSIGRSWSRSPASRRTGRRSADRRRGPASSRRPWVAPGSGSCPTRAA